MKITLNVTCTWALPNVTDPKANKYKLNVVTWGFSFHVITYILD